MVLVALVTRRSKKVTDGWAEDQSPVWSVSWMRMGMELASPAGALARFHEFGLSSRGGQ